MLCSIHRGYKAIRRPKVPCEQCWDAWMELHGDEPFAADWRDCHVTSAKKRVT